MVQRIIPDFSHPMRIRSPAGLAFRAVVFLTLIAEPARAQLRRDAGAALTDAEFWRVFSTMSEPGGSFPSENFVSNEMTYQYVIPSLQKTVRPDGVYLGVGPEQNFTYIANLKPRLAIIFDIRRQNAMAHLMYKAIFEMSPTRADFVARLFSRPLANRVPTTAKVDDLFAVALGAEPSDSAYDATQKAVFANLVGKHHFVLTPGDSAAIEHLMEVFFEAGPELNYAYRFGRPGAFSAYPTYSLLQARTNADSVQMAFLATEENYRVVRDMQVRNLIVPVVGDFAGPKAIRAVGDYLKQRRLSVQAFYLSNVEQYLFQNGVASEFYDNVATLPIDSTSAFIRSVPPSPGGGFSGAMSMRIISSGGFTSSFFMYDSAGSRWMRTTQDSTGVTITRLYRDSAGTFLPIRTDSSRRYSSIPMPNIVAPGAGRFGVGPARPSTMVLSGGSLVSGIAPIGTTIADYKAGRVKLYTDIIAMTKLDGWK
jgi:hypothetical protein